MTKSWCAKLPCWETGSKLPANDPRIPTAAAATEGTVAQGEPTSVIEIGVTLGTSFAQIKYPALSRVLKAVAFKTRERAGQSGVLREMTWGFIDLAIAKIVHSQATAPSVAATRLLYVTTESTDGLSFATCGKAVKLFHPTDIFQTDLNTVASGQDRGFFYGNPKALACFGVAVRNSCRPRGGSAACPTGHG